MIQQDHWVRNNWCRVKVVDREQGQKVDTTNQPKVKVVERTRSLCPHDAQELNLVTRWDLDIVSTNTSPTEQDQGGETTETEEQASKLVIVEERGNNRLNMVTSGPNGPDPKNTQASCSKRKTISKQWIVPPALPPAIPTRCLPHSPQPACSGACPIPPCCPQVAAASSSCPVKQPCSCWPRRMKLCQEGTVIPKHLYMNVNTEKIYSWRLQVSICHHDFCPMLSSAGMTKEDLTAYNIWTLHSPTESWRNPGVTLHSDYFNSKW